MKIDFIFFIPNINSIFKRPSAKLILWAVISCTSKNRAVARAVAIHIKANSNVLQSFGY